MQPKVFISHASEDKARFVMGFATALRARGIDAWVDRWEMLLGDSLVDKIFEEGIRNATAFIVVLSENSVNKKWVREELNAAIVKKIENGSKIIPVLIDDIVVPESLKSTLWIRIRDLGNYDDELSQILDSIFGHFQKPPLGEPPKYTQLSIDTIQGLEEIDTLVLKAACEKEIELGHNFVNTDDLFSALEQQDLPENVAEDALEILDSRGYIRGSKAGNGTIIALRLTTYGFQEYARTFIPDFNDQIARVAYHLLNELEPRKAAHTSEIAEELGLAQPIVEHIVEIFDLKGWIRKTDMARGYLVSRVSPEFKRAFAT